MTAKDESHPAGLDLRDLPQSDRPVLKVMARAAALLLVSAWVLFLMAWLALYGVLLPRVGAWKPEMEARASAALGVTVRIGQIEVPSSGWVPALVLSEVALLDEQGRTALRLPRVSAALSVQSLLSLELRFEQLLIEGAALEIRRDPSGRIRVGGLRLDDDTPQPVDGGQASADWLLAQGEFAIRGGQVRWVDEWRGAPPLVLQDVDFVLRNGLRRHEFRLDATLPAPLGQRASLRGRFRHGLFVSRSDWRQWVGEVYAELPQADADALRPHVDLPAELVSGQGAARVWVDVDRGRVRGATADVALREVALRWPGVSETMSFARFEGRLLARQDAQSVTLGLERVGFTTGQGQTWPASDMKLVLRHAPAPQAAVLASPAPASSPGAERDDPEAEPALPLLWDGLAGRVITGGDFSAAELDLGLMASVAGRAPLGAALHRHLLSLAPQGRIQDMKASWEGPADQPSRYRVTARLEGLRLEPGGEPAANRTGPPAIGRPGVRGATIQLEATESGGRADLVIQQGLVVFPGLFDQPEWRLDDLQARLTWQLKENLEVRLSPLALRSADFDGEVNGTWRGSWQDAAHGRGVLDLNARIQSARADSLHAHLPTTVSAATRAYLKRAVRGGRLQDVSIRVKGDLAEFPFDRPGTKGEFRVNGAWRDGTFLMVPEEPGAPAWPEATRVDARIKVTGQRVEFSEVRGRLMGLEVTRTNGTVDWMVPSVPLTLDLQARGAAQDFLRYVQATPINDWSSRVLASAQATGSANLALKLELPLVGSDPSRVKGSVQLGGNELRLSPNLPPLQQARGRVDFSEKGFSVMGATAQLLGGEVALEGGISPGGATRLNLQGTAQAASVKAAPELAWLAPLSARLSGQTPYRISVGVLGGQLNWVLTSPLTGLGIDLPAPLTKPASANWTQTPLRVELTALGGVAGAERERLDVQLGRLVQARFVRHAQTGAVMAGAVGVGMAEPPAMPRSGTDVRVVAEHLELDEWRALVMPSAAAGAHTGAGGATTPAASTAWDALALGMPTSLQLRANSVMLMGRQLDSVVAQAQPLLEGSTSLGWRVDLQAAQLAGRVEWRPAEPGLREPNGRVLARLSRLSIPPPTHDTAEDSAVDERIEWPALDVVVEDFELRGRRLGRLEVRAEVERRERAGPTRGGGGDWKLTRFALSNADAALSASGTWAGTGDAVARTRRTAMDFELELKDSGALLKRLGLEQALRAGAGRITGQLAWRGSPLSPDVRTMQGQLRLDLRSGQFLKADPGAARLLGVLSLQALPRRLLLDFRDVFQEGFPFDSITGDVAVVGGVASTNNLRMRGIQAAVLMEGNADLNRETQDLRVLVVPEINAGTASLAYATINPALGLGTFLAQLFLRRPLMAANTREFSITGTWIDPKVERLQRSVPTTEQVDRAVNPPAPAASPATTGASSPLAPPDRRPP